MTTMGIMKFLQRLTGTTDDAVEEDTRFKTNLQMADSMNALLDKLQYSLSEVTDKVGEEQDRISRNPSSNLSGPHSLDYNSKGSHE